MSVWRSQRCILFAFFFSMLCAVSGRAELPASDHVVLWLKADAGVQKDGNNLVSVWQDQSGNSNDISQSNSSYQPLWVAGALGGNPVVRFTGHYESGLPYDNDYMSAQSGRTTLNPSTISIFVVGTFRSLPFGIFMNKESQYRFLAGDADGYHLSARGAGWAATIGETALSTDTPYLIESVFDSVNWHMYLNGVSDGRQTMSGNLNTTESAPLIIGSYCSYWFGVNIDAAEIIIYNKPLSDEERHSVEVYLADKYQLPAPPPLDAGMGRRAVLDDPRMDTGAVYHLERVVNWLGDNGFQRLDGDEIAAWMDEQTDSETGAYGSVAVLPGSYAPTTIFLYTDGETPRWLEYVNAGGRIVTGAGFPLGLAETPDASPLPFRDVLVHGIYLIDIPTWGEYLEWSRPVTLNTEESAAAWEFEVVGCSGRGVPRANVTTCFDLYTTSAQLAGTAKWFKNTNPAYPYSGLVCAYNYNPEYNTAALMRDVYRAAVYMGDPLTFPELNAPIVPVTPDISITCAASGMSGRSEFVRGETAIVVMTAKSGLGATHIRMDLKWKNDVIYTQTQAVDGTGTDTFILDTAPYAYGPYELVGTALNNGTPVGTNTADIGVRYVRPEGFLYGIWAPWVDNPMRGDLQFADIRQAGMEALLSDPSPLDVDAAIRQNIGFTARILPDLTGGQSWYWPTDEEHFRLNSNGSPYPYGSGYLLNLTHSDHRSNAFSSLQEQAARFADIPAFRPYMFTNDDYSGLGYGWDYSDAALADFTSRTGQTAPTAMPSLPTPGAIPDNDNWRTWSEYCMQEVNGGFIRAEREAVTGVRPDIKIGPIPGGAQLPLVGLVEPTQYPTYDFGNNGFNLVSFYDYDVFWMPLLVYTFWTEIGHMGNRQTPEIVVPDCQGTPGYSRNNFYNILAGGAKGIEYFCFEGRNRLTWDEFYHLGEVARRIGPVQSALEPAYRDIALLDSFATSIYYAGQPTYNRAYALFNLLQAHFSVDIVAETEILQPGFLNNYRGVLLYDIHYLPQSVYTALQNYISGGGLVVMDWSVPFSISGAARVNIDVGEGAAKNQYAQTYPGYDYYGLADRVNLVETSLQPLFNPAGQRYDINIAGTNNNDLKVIATQFKIDYVPYTWFVNVHDHEENDLGRYYWTRDIPVFQPTDASLQDLSEWETGQMAAPYSASVTTDTWLGYPYDLVTGSAIDYEPASGGKYLLTWDIERFGGSLVAFYSEPIGTLTLSTNGHAPAGEEFVATATVCGATTGNPMPGMVPVEFTLTDPTGTESPISQVVGTINGVATLAWTPAVNDPAGDGWTVTARELASNQSAANSVSIGTNTPPTVSISSPTEGYSTTAPATINITAGVSDDGIITRVEFYNNGILLGTDTSSSGGWTYSWANVAASGDGGIKLTAKAYDNDNAVTTSAVRSCTVTDSALKCYWKFDETGGSTAYDTSGTGNNGTLYNSPTRITGEKIINCISFNGTSQYVQKASARGLPNVDANQTECFWFYVSSNPTATKTALAVTYGTGSTGKGTDIGFINSSGMKFAVWRNSTKALIVSTSTLPSSGSWHHVAYVKSGSNKYLYIDGTAVTSTSSTDTSSTATYITAARTNYSSGANFWPGKLDEVRIYNRALSVAEIQALAQGKQ